jgi:glycosyltransferase involved in cell wall biosynthesis
MSSRKPKISIITAVYNSAETLQSCIDSVRCQSYPNVEFIVIDGASTDESVDIIERNEDAITSWTSEPDRGVYHAWNKGLDLAEGDWIHFLGADDRFMDGDVLSRVAEALGDVGPDIRVVYGKEAIVSGSGEVLETRGESWEVAGKLFTKVMSIPHPTVFHHKSLFEDHGNFDESFRVCADYELLLRELKTGQARYLDGPAIKAVRFGGISTSPKKCYLVALEMPRAKQLNGIFPYHWSWCWITVKASGKYSLNQMLGPASTRWIIDTYRRLTGRPAVWTKT